jgi:hypothetical protein
MQPSLSINAVDGKYNLAALIFQCCTVLTQIIIVPKGPDYSIYIISSVIPEVAFTVAS